MTETELEALRNSDIPGWEKVKVLYDNFFVTGKIKSDLEFVDFVSDALLITKGLAYTATEGYFRPKVNYN